jgi:hypothetical protein
VVEVGELWAWTELEMELEIGKKDLGLTACDWCSAAQSTTISKRRKFVADGVFYAELNEFFTRELAEEGYSGVEVRVTPTVTDISTSPRSVRFLEGCGGEMG